MYQLILTETQWGKCQWVVIHMTLQEVPLEVFLHFIDENIRDKKYPLSFNQSMTHILTDQEIYNYFSSIPIQFYFILIFNETYTAGGIKDIWR